RATAHIATNPRGRHTRPTHPPRAEDRTHPGAGSVPLRPMDRARHGSGALSREECSFASVAHLRAGKVRETDARVRFREDFLDLRDGPGHRLVEPARACARLAPDLVD